MLTLFRLSAARTFCFEHPYWLPISLAEKPFSYFSTNCFEKSGFSEIIKSINSMGWWRLDNGVLGSPIRPLGNFGSSFLIVGISE